MHQTKTFPAPTIGLLALALAAPGAAFAYGEKDAIRDCESRIRSEYHLTDLRDAHAERLTDSEHHYKVQGVTKLDGNRHPWTCEVKNRHVAMAEYSGPKPKGMGTAEKLAIGAAAAIAAGVAVNEMSKHSTSDQPDTAMSSAGTAKAGIPLFNGSCPGGIEVHADEGGAVYLNGKEAKLKKFNNNFYEAKGAGITLSISLNPDETVSLSYTGKHGTNGVCAVSGD
jgi:hypothetical protein